MEGKIDMAARRQVTNKLRGRYRRASKADKGEILDRVVATPPVGRHRHVRRRNADPGTRKPGPDLGHRTCRDREKLCRRLMAEQWILANYSVLVLDPEGDHVQLQQLNRVQVFDGGHHLSEPVELLTMLQPHSSMVVDMSALSEPTKVDDMYRLRSAAEAHRHQYGYPHWVIYDEAHLLSGGEHAHWARRGGYVLSSFAPASLPAHEIDASDVVLTLTTGDATSGIASRRRASIRIGSEPVREFTIAQRQTAHVRHWHKYVDIGLPHDRRFYFHTSARQTIAPAATMRDFDTAVRHLDQQTLEYHLERGDFSRWLAGTIADKDLATQVAAWEDELLANRAAGLERIRHHLAQAVQERYLPAQEPD
ncbi:hypothetical protein LAUMK41_02179 [Mycobacterium attenuatum]|nr:hypothetical protein LAUMK41_02179 [Mycobacterium attenuatum]